ncbi:hypothetical protein RBSWK_03068 [Rhodopirellula baltica SWK14]|uniref:Uncharacterized protein n=2 Tax=Rhodopirellula baltica TaxID=265606 RepID=L7CHW3_RHOBT|nr:hypothetical protein RBSWK_03068 [Rhodopirellula baltica SWK14]
MEILMENVSKMMAPVAILVTVLLAGTFASDAFGERGSQKLTLPDFTEVDDLRAFLFENGHDSLALSRLEVESSLPCGKELGTIQIVGDSRYKRVVYLLPLGGSEERLVLSFATPKGANAEKLCGFWIEAN